MMIKSQKAAKNMYMTSRSKSK